jgi:hypothetical protein
MLIINNTIFQSKTVLCKPTLVNIITRSVRQIGHAPKVLNALKNKTKQELAQDVSKTGSLVKPSTESTESTDSKSTEMSARTHVETSQSTTKLTTLGPHVPQSTTEKVSHLVPGRYGFLLGKSNTASTSSPSQVGISDTKSASSTASQASPVTSTSTSSSSYGFTPPPPPKHVLTPDSPHVLQGKESIIRFCDYFKDVSMQDTDNVVYLINYYKRLLEEDPSLYNRTMQLSMEFSFSKLKFYEQDLQNIFKDLTLIDLIGRNNGLTDSSTLFSLLQAQYLLSQPGFKSNTEMRVVISTCVQSHNIKDISPELKNKMQVIKNATGNTVNDIDIDNHPHDFKMIRDIVYSKNHIIFLDYSDFSTFVTSKKYMHNLSIHWKNIIENSPNNFNTEFYKAARTKLNSIKDESSATEVQKIEQWNQYIFENLHKRPVTAYIPIIIPTSKIPFEANPLLIEHVKQIALPNSKTLDTTHVRKAIWGLANSWDISVQNKAHAVTKGVISKQQELPTKDVDNT